ncbi:unnamed protein product [Cuscuta campestris]|uniref:Pectin acetylesterase n=1 Tax=Cuscuta campestris TaxID=132261 RepID=A0A484KF40_9ASTE|nr:unnamed protein product [Cuscuta campestris]
MFRFEDVLQACQRASLQPLRVGTQNNHPQHSNELMMSKGMRYANQALFSGCSAGGLAAILHCDEFRNLFPQNSNEIHGLRKFDLYLGRANLEETEPVLLSILHFFSQFFLVSVHPQLIAGSEKRRNRASAAVATTNRRHVFSDQGRPSFKVRYAHKEKRGKDEMMNAKRLLVYMFDVMRVSVELSYG